MKRYEKLVLIQGRRCGTIRPAVSRRERDEELVRAEGLEPSRTLRSNGFSCPLRLSPPPLDGSRVWGLDYLFAMPGITSGIRRCPSSLYTFPAGLGPGLARDRHFTGFPEFEQFCTAGFPTGTQVLSLKSDASADSATPARFQTQHETTTDPIGL